MRGVSCHPLLPSFSFLNVVIGFLVAWSPKPYYLLYALALIGFTTDASVPCRQAQVELLGPCFDIVREKVQNQRPLALLVYRLPLGASALAGSGELGKEEGHSSHSS